MTNEITILSTISEGRVFNILKARRSTKFVILKVAAHPDGMTEALLKKEYEIGLTLHASQIVTTLNFSLNTPAGPAIILEYIEGSTLQKSNIDKRHRDRILKDILDGVEYLHHKGILHNDLKPANIIITPEGYARIIDLGLSISDDSIYKYNIGGTKTYTAPEILTGRGPAGAPSDIYSVGCIIQFLYGKGKFRRISEKCTAYDPLERYQSIDTLRKALSRERRVFPVICAAAAIFLTIAIAFIPTGEKIITEITTENLKEEYHALLDSQFFTTIKLMSEQQYRELAKMVYNRNYSNKILLQFMDSLNTNFPISETGVIPPEIFAICAVNTDHQKIYDSIINQLPTIEELPYRQQKALKDSLRKVLTESGL